MRGAVPQTSLVHKWNKNASVVKRRGVCICVATFICRYSTQQHPAWTTALSM